MYFSSKSIRMCIGCRQKLLQQELLRLRHSDGKISAFEGSGRSFYFCKECLQDERILCRSLSRFRGLEKRQQSIKEIQEIAKIWIK